MNGHSECCLYTAHLLVARTLDCLRGILIQKKCTEVDTWRNDLVAGVIQERGRGYEGVKTVGKAINMVF